jgi:hypothetical protein
VTTGAPATIWMFSDVIVPPQDLHFMVSILTLPGKSILYVTLVVFVSGFAPLRDAR